MEILSLGVQFQARALVRFPLDIRRIPPHYLICFPAVLVFRKCKIPNSGQACHPNLHRPSFGALAFTMQRRRRRRWRLRSLHARSGTVSASLHSSTYQSIQHPTNQPAGQPASQPATVKTSIRLGCYQPILSSIYCSRSFSLFGLCCFGYRRATAAAAVVVVAAAADCYSEIQQQTATMGDRILSNGSFQLRDGRASGQTAFETTGKTGKRGKKSCSKEGNEDLPSCYPSSAAVSCFLFH